jgi:hypothetical protein
LVGSSVEGERREVEAEGGEEKEGKEGGGGDSSIQNLTSGDDGGKLLADTREWIKEMMVVETLKDFAICVGLSVDANVMVGVTREFGEKGDITKIEWKSKSLNGNLDKFKDLATRMPRLQVLDLDGNSDLKGDLTQWHLPVGMKSVNLRRTRVTGDVTQLRLPNSMQSLNLSGDHWNPMQITAPPGCPRGSSYDFNYNEDNLSRLRSWVSLTATQGGAAGEDGNEGKAGGDGEGATEMEALRAFAEGVGYKGRIMDGVVTECAGGAIEEIHWMSKILDGTLPMGDLNMPKLRVLDLFRNQSLKGAVDKIVLPEGMQSVNFQECYGLAGDLTQWHLPVGMKNLNLSQTGVTGAVDKIVLPEGMQTVNFCSCTRLTGDLTQWHLPVGMNHLDLRRTRVTGAVDKIVLPEGMQTVDFSTCYDLAGDLTQWHLPVGMKDLKLRETKVTASPGYPRGSSYNFNYNEDDLNRLRSWISLTATQGGAGEDGNEGKAGGDGEEATVMEALRAFAKSVGYKGDIMDGVVTECAGGAIEEIRWNRKNLDGALPVGDLNMPKLRVLELYGNDRLEGDVTQLRLPDSMRFLNLSASFGGTMQITGAVDKLSLPEGMQSVNFCGCVRLTGAVDKIVLPDGMQYVGFLNCRGLTGKLPASEKAKVKAYRGP